MPEVLDQSEVDALLAAVSSTPADAPAPAPSASPAEKPALGTHVRRPDVRDYDFKRPERVSKDQIRALEAIHEGFARNLGASLSGFLRTIIEVRVGAIAQLTYSEFIHSLPNPTNFNLLSVEPLNGQMCLEISPLIIYPIIDRLLGGSNADVFVPQRPLTIIELRLVKHITDRALACLKEVWRNLAEVEFALADTESNPHLVQIVAPNEVVVVISFELRMGERIGTMSLCIPFNVIEPVIGRLAAQSWHAYQRRSPNVDQHELMTRSLQQTRVEVQVHLAETTITVQELLDLRMGDIIETQKSAGCEVMVQVEGRQKFLGRLGQYSGRKAVKITRKDDAAEDAGASGAFAMAS